MSDLIRETGISLVADFEHESRRGDRIGTQAMSYMDIPQSVADKQMAGWRKRLQELSTESGVKKHVLANVDSDWIAQ